MTENRRCGRQDYIMSPLLLNIYLKYIFREASEVLEAGLLLNEEILNNFRHAGDTVVFTEA